MAPRSHEEIAKEKRVPKGEIKFHIPLNDEQKEAKSIILNSVISVLKGQAGSGKSLLASQISLDLLFKRQYEKIIIIRPTVEAASPIGFLPGDISNKLAPFTAPVFENMFRLYDKQKIETLVSEGRIEILPVNFIRGRNFTNSIIIIDEAQNLTGKGMEMIMSRLCLGSKMIMCGDSAQIDLPKKSESGLDFVCKNMINIDGFSVVELKQNHRHPIVADILKIYSSCEI